MALTDQLISYWKFDEDTGTTAFDATSNANNLTLANTPPWVAGKIGFAVQYDGSSQDANVGSNPASLDIAAGGSITMSLWIFVTGTIGASPYYGLIAKRNDALGTPYAYGINYNVAAFQVYTSGGNGIKAFTYTPPTNTWTHICGVIDTVNGTILYVNGALVSNLGGSGGVASNTASLTVASSGKAVGGAEQEFFPGNIDEVGIWSRALTSAEVAQLYNSGNGFQYPFSTTTGGWTMAFK